MLVCTHYALTMHSLCTHYALNMHSLCTHYALITSAVSSMFYERGLELGLQRGELSAAQDNLLCWLKIVSPLVYGSIYNR
jgi:hypothetical protein